MEIRDLRAFVMVLELGGFTRAASRLHVVQPTVSQAVARLERELGVQLVERRPGGVRPTPAGSDFLGHARTILNSVDRAESDMAAHRGLSKGRVNLGMVPTVTPLLMAPLLRRLRERHPGLDVHLEEAAAAELIDRVRVGHVDLGISLLPANADGLAVEPLSNQPLAVFIGAGHRLWDRPDVRLVELSDENWVSYPSGNPGRVWLERACRKAGFVPRVAAEVYSPAQMKPYIQAGWGVSMVPLWQFDADVEQGTLRALRVTVPRSLTCTIASVVDSRHVSKAMTVVQGEIREIVRQVP